MAFANTGHGVIQRDPLKYVTGLSVVDRTVGNFITACLKSPIKISNACLFFYHLC